MRVYLSGGMEYADREGAAWRMDIQSWIENELKHDVFNPNIESDKFFMSRYPEVDFRTVKRNDLALYRDIVRQLVEIDCREIAEHSDYLICYWDESAAKGAGTKGELTIARFFGKPVYLVSSYPGKEIPGWVLGCTTEMFPDFDQLKRFLIRELRQNGKR